jgi:hypothetical protein
MFFHYTDNLKLIVPLRCGSSTLHEYFGYNSRHQYFDQGFEQFHSGAPAARVIVLRHPYERYWSSCALLRDQLGTEQWAWHFTPFLDEVHDCDWRYIPFTRLKKYVSYISTDTKVVNVKNKTLERNLYQTNPYVSYEQLVEEVRLYEQAVVERSVLKVKDWHRLTR